MRILKTLLCLTVVIFGSNSISSGFWFSNEFNDSIDRFQSLNSRHWSLNEGVSPVLYRNYFASVKRLTLSQNVIFSGCGEEQERCSENKMTIEVWSEARDPDNDSLEYVYKVDGGKIVGKGEKVVWDLSEAEPGEYTIVAGVDDGCGVCGFTKSKTVYVVRCPENVSEAITPGFLFSLKLNQNETFSSCNLSIFAKFDPENSCLGKKSMILVSANAHKSNDTNAIFKYEVTDGQIVGNGDDVYWDLSQAKPGTHVITARVDAGRGFCTNAVSESVKVAECPKCRRR